MKKKLCQSCAKRVISFPEALEGIQYLRGQDEWGEGGQKLSIFVHTQGIKTILAGVGGMGSKIGYFCPRADQGIKTILAGGTLMFYGFCVPLSDFRSIFNFCQTKQTGCQMKA